MLTASTVHGEAVGARRLGPEDMPSSLVGERGSEDERAGGDERVGAAGLGVIPMHTGPWNRKERPCHNGSGSDARSSCCPRRKEGSFVGCSAKGYLTEDGGRGIRRSD